MPHDQLRDLARRFGLLCAGSALLIVSSCSRDSTGPESGPPGLSHAIISSPIAPRNGASTRSTRASADATESSGNVTFVSMHPGTAPSAVSVSIKRLGDTTSPTSAPIVDGGFDPIAIIANAGDTLSIVTIDAHGDRHPGIGLVTRHRPPGIVRTSPAGQRTDVPLNTGILIVFTEPMDSASIVNGITLQLGDVVVPTTISLVVNDGGAIQVTVQPLAPLDPDQTYNLVISTTVLNLLGESMAAPVVIPFTTGTATDGTGDLVINSFFMRKYHFASPVSEDDYAPRLLVTNPAGSSIVHITKFTMVSMGNFPFGTGNRFCAKGMDIAPGQTVQLFPIFDGNFSLEWTWDKPVVASSAFARLDYRRDDEFVKEITLEGEIIPGNVGTYSEEGVGGWEDCPASP